MAPNRNLTDDGHVDRGAPADPSTSSSVVGFGKPMLAEFEFAPTYRNVNHGSYGTYPSAVGRARERYLHAYEARPDLFKRLDFPSLIEKSRSALVPLLGPDVHVNEVVFVANATTGVNVVLQNLAARWSAPSADKGDAVLYFKPIYEACHKTLQVLVEVGRLHAVEIPLSYPADDDDTIVERLRAVHAETVRRGLTPRMAVFDTVASAPGVLMPWQRLTAACRELGILSLVDAAHAIGQIDLTQLGSPEIQPDFFVSNCHKWLFVPRGCAVFYVPFRNQHLIETSLPTSHGYLLPKDRGPLSTAGSNGFTVAALTEGSTYFTNLFLDVGTMDYTPWMCIPDAIAFRRDVCGGEEAIRKYCFDLARAGGDRVAEILGTEVMDNPRSNIRQCTMVNVRLPFDIKADNEIASDDTTTVPRSSLYTVFTWLLEEGAEKYDTYFRVTLYEGRPWVRLSAQVYLDLEDFEWSGKTLLTLCDGVKNGVWQKT